MRRKWFVVLPIGLAAMVVVGLVGGTVVRLLWNWLMPSLFGAPIISFWQALGLLALCRILFGGIGPRGVGHRAGGRFRERWHRMTPEERERFRAGMGRHFGWQPPADGPTPQ
jgi:hypothetical protein